VNQIVFSQSGATRMTTSKQYDYLSRPGSISSRPSNSFAYQYNAANQQTLNRLLDGSHWRYSYDSLGQVISGNKYWVDVKRAVEATCQTCCEKQKVQKVRTDTCF
jgi:YD repeat-containing protein